MTSETNLLSVQKLHSQRGPIHQKRVRQRGEGHQAICLGDGARSLGRKRWNAMEAKSTGLATELAKTFTHVAMDPCLLLLAAFAKPVTPLQLGSTHSQAVSVILCNVALLWDHRVLPSGEGRRQNLPLCSSFIFQVHSPSTLLSFSG